MNRVAFPVRLCVCLASFDAALTEQSPAPNKKTRPTDAEVAEVDRNCWTHGFTRGECCNYIFGPFGNTNCWDHGKFNFEFCCQGEVFVPTKCSHYVNHFSWSAIGWGYAKDDVEVRATACAKSMEENAERCNAVNITSRSCPECAHSQHLLQYIRCIREEQRSPAASSSCPACCDGPADGGGGSSTIVGGEHYPTLLRPRADGRDFTLMATAFDMTVGTSLISSGRWMPHETRLLEGFLPRGGVMVDAGANIGGFAVPLSKHVGPDGQVHAFEPFRSTFQILNANCAMNGLISCLTYHNALGNRTERLKLRSPGLNAVSNPSKFHIVGTVSSELFVHYDGAGRTENVEVVRLDDRLELDRLDLLKIDVESSEYDMLLGSRNTIQRFHPVIYVEDSELGDTPVIKEEEPSQVMLLLEREHGYGCIHLPKEGLVLMTSLLCVRKETMTQARQKLRSINWRITT